MDYKLISGDGHIDLRDLPHDVFAPHAPAKWKDKAPRLVETKAGKRWFVEGRDVVATYPDVRSSLASLKAPTQGISKHTDRMFEVGYFEGEPHPGNPELRIRDQEIDGVDADVIYGILRMAQYVEDRELLRWIYETYNTWVADFRKTNPDRFAVLACIPNEDPEAAAVELRRVAKLGVNGAEFSAPFAVKPLWHRDWDPLWAASDKCGIPISFHTVGIEVRTPSDEQMARDYQDEYIGTRTTTVQLDAAEYLASLIFSGALERHPGMKFVLGESGVGWIPYVLARMDMEYDDRFRHLNFSMKPSDYWRRQGYTTFQHETNLADLVHLAGEDNVIWGSDYPHADGVWPDSQESIEIDLGKVDPKVRRKVTCDNAARLYGLTK